MQKLKKPRRVMLLVKAGSAVDEFIRKLIPLLDKGDIIIDGGNSEYKDTQRRCKELKEKGLLYVGSGVSGGEEGASKYCSRKNHQRRVASFIIIVSFRIWSITYAGWSF